MSETYYSRVYTDRPAYADFDAPAKFQAIESIIAKRLKEHPNAIRPRWRAHQRKGREKDLCTVLSAIKENNMSKFNVGDKVRVRNCEAARWLHCMYPERFPVVGTVGTVETARAFGRVQWPKGSTSGNDCWAYHDDYLEFVPAQPRKILVMQDKADPSQVIARDLDSGKVGVAQCSPQDSFDFYTGAKLAFDRLMGREEKKPEEPKPEPKKLLNMKVVCVERAPGILGVEPSWWTLGKVYNVVFGVIRDDDGERRAPVHSLDELNKNMGGYAKFVEYKGGA